MNTIIQRIVDGKFVLIAEIGVNYYDIAKQRSISNMDAAKLMIQEAKKAGIHVVKFQTYKAEGLAVRESPAYWDITEEPTVSQYELFKKFDAFGEDEYKELKQYADSINIEFMSTAFDIISADYLDNLMDIYKISSSDLNNIPFIAHQAKKNKPIILSVGASDLDEIKTAVEEIRKYNDKPLVLMHCVLEYPTPYAHANLNKIVSLKKEFPNLYIGYSDHTKPDAGYDVIKTAYNLGATVIEKHFTLDKTLLGNDHYHAMDVADAECIIKGIEFLDSIRGEGSIQCLKSELIARENARRSLVSKVDIEKGQKIELDMITFKRPGTGISPNELDNLVGKIAKVSISADTTLVWDMID